ncbi:hypothetical protein MPH_00043 [Macrophomina phaseolina MS6]|uniref:HhH-GPD domain-containing protein n=1 Tax=Macrophomina phaseolina (strain MS6) TaxID=1126212 RepID=K2T0Z6_MACPH|nr:hypothetical protein MPH_00043 [Macrophomina phaseolina MS6]
MKNTYGSVFAYDNIYAGGPEKLQETIRCGGLHVRKTRIIMSILEEVRRRHGRWDLDHLLDASDEDAMKELMSYKYIGPKSAFVVMGWCLKRNRFTVDTHVYRIAGLWGWRPKEATREKTQSHLDAVIPVELKFKLHFFLIQHGRTCPACRGGSKGDHQCAVQAEVKRKLKTEKSPQAELPTQFSLPESQRLSPPVNSYWFAHFLTTANTTEYVLMSQAFVLPTGNVSIGSSLLEAGNPDNHWQTAKTVPLQNNSTSKNGKLSVKAPGFEVSSNSSDNIASMVSRGSTDHYQYDLTVKATSRVILNAWNGFLLLGKRQYLAVVPSKLSDLWNVDHWRLGLPGR